MLDAAQCKKARMSKDGRFDGQFFIAVRTTGIYCRPICRVTPPKEKNVSYFPSAVAAAAAGYRPCLRCRPDSAPGSAAWKGVNTTLDRAISLIGEGALQDHSLTALADRLGVSDRYLRQLFQRNLGVSPKTFALYQQCLFAKKLLHESSLPITQIALASGFNSVRRFNDCFRREMGLTPTQVRKSEGVTGDSLKLKLSYRPPYDWTHMQAFLARRTIPKLEWSDTDSYGRTFEWLGARGSFTATHCAAENRFDLKIDIDKLEHLRPVINNIRRILDLDADIATVQQALKGVDNRFSISDSGIRLPGIWSVFEAGIRAILGQQISVVAARNLTTTLTEQLGVELDHSGIRLFPTPEAIASNSLECLKIPGSRKNTLKNLARFFIDENDPSELDGWLQLKGIGPWTVQYARMRGLSDPDIYLGGDLGVKKAIGVSGADFDPQHVSPWRSYLTIQLWNLL